MLIELQGKGLLIHHWDTDGICSARLLLDYLDDKKIENKTPELGNYYLTEEELKNYSKYDYIIIADMALPEKQILKLAEKAKVMIFDHHLQKEITQVFHHNPVIKGENPNDYPSASWIVNDYLKNKLNIFAILGIIGDHEQKIKKNKKFSEIINEFCKQNNMTFDDLHKMVYYLDSNYKIGNKNAVEEVPHQLLSYSTGKEILNNYLWKKNYEKLNHEITKIIESPFEEIHTIILKKINTKYNIISTITRKVAWESGKNTLVINTGFFESKDQIYMRSKKNAEPMIKRGKELGFKCGGKNEVLGAIVPKDQTESFVNELIEFLK